MRLNFQRSILGNRHFFDKDLTVFIEQTNTYPPSFCPDRLARFKSKSKTLNRSLNTVHSSLTLLHYFQYNTHQKTSVHSLIFFIDGNLLYVLQINSHDLSVIDLSNFTVTKKSGYLANSPWGITMSHDGKTLWVAVGGADVILTLDPMTLNKQDTTRVNIPNKPRSSPISVAESASGHYVFSLNMSANTISRHDRNNKLERVGQNIETPPHLRPYNKLYATPDGQYLIALFFKETENHMSMMTVIDIQNWKKIGDIPLKAA